MKLAGVAGEQLRVQGGIIPRSAFATTQLQLLLVDPWRQVRASHPTVQILLVVGDLSLQRYGHHERVAQELDRASKCLATKLIQAQCEVAIKKSNVLSNSVCASKVAGALDATWWCRLPGRSGTLASISQQDSRPPRLCGGRGWKYPKGVSSESGRSTGDRQSHLRQRLAMFAEAAVANGNHHGVSQ